MTQKLWKGEAHRWSWIFPADSFQTMIWGSEAQTERIDLTGERNRIWVVER